MSEAYLKEKQDDDEKIKLQEKVKKLVDNRLKSVTSHNYFHGHGCHLDAEDLSIYDIKLSRFRQYIFNFITVRVTDVRGTSIYRSYTALCAEKYRHYMYHPFTIHPFSSLRSYIEITVCIIMILQGLLFAIHYIKIDAGLEYAYACLTYFSDFFYIMHIISNFFTGYVEGECQKVVVMDLNKIMWNYMKTWLVVDVLSAMTFIPLLTTTYSDNPMLYFVSETAKLLRVPCSAKYLQNFLHNLRISRGTKTIVEVILCIIMYLSWNIYFQFAVEYSIEGTTNPLDPRTCSWLTYGKMWNQSWVVRFHFALERGVGMLTKNTNLRVIEDLGCFEIFFVISWLLSQILIFHFALKYVILLFGTESARAKYYIMQKQVEYYMIQRKLPERLKKKILKFYAIRFHSRYFTEARLLAIMTGQLRDDITMLKGRQILNDLNFLKLLPRSLLMQVIFKLKEVIYIAGDIIYKINTIDDCLYFVDKGTVAIYTESGQEICHVEDGDFFGEGALLMQSRFRIASAVAVTNCELYRLDKEDFDTTIAYYPTVLETIAKIAIQRFEEKRVVDEHRKADLKNAEKNVWSPNS